MWENVKLSKRKIAKEGIMAVFKTKFRRFKILKLSLVHRKDRVDLFKYLSSLINSDSFHIEQVVVDDDMYHEIPTDLLAYVLAHTKIIDLGTLRDHDPEGEATAKTIEMIAKIKPTVIEYLNLDCKDNFEDSTPLQPTVIGEALYCVNKTLIMPGNDRSIDSWSSEQMTEILQHSLLNLEH